MQHNLEAIHRWLGVSEGGYVNHPKDPGGATNKGVTQRVYDAWRRGNGLTVQSVRHISSDEQLEIFKEGYWDAVQADKLPDGLDYAVVDFGYHSGPSRAVKNLQRLVGGIAVDGVVGAETLNAVRGYPKEDLRSLIEDYCTRRLDWMRTLSTFSTFGRGWTRRVMGEEMGVQDRDTGVIDRSCALATGWGPSTITPPKVVAPGKAEDKDQKVVPHAKEGLTAENLAKVLGGAIPAGVLTSAASGPIQWAIAGAVVVVAVVVLVKMLRR